MRRRRRRKVLFKANAVNEDEEEKDVGRWQCRRGLAGTGGGEGGREGERVIQRGGERGRGERDREYLSLSLSLSIKAVKWVAWEREGERPSATRLQIAG